MVTDPLTVSIGTHYNKSGAEVGLRWVVQQTARTAVVVKADSVKVRFNMERVYRLCRRGRQSGQRQGSR